MAEKPTLSNALSSANMARSMVKDALSWYKGKFMYTATLSNEAYIFNEVLQWLYRHHRGRSVNFDVERNGINRKITNTGGKIVLDGYIIKFSVEESTKESDRIIPLSRTLTFTCYDREGIESLYRLFDRIRQDKAHRPETAYLMTHSTYGWNAKDFYGRNIDSVILPPGMKEDIISDLDNFINNEEFFSRVGLPWHRGYLLSGPPGNGKTSLASALAAYYKMHLYTLSLSSVKSDSALATNIADIDARSILLLEDIDIFTKTMGREQKDDAPTLAGLLNALDGVATPHGIITIMTTNVVESLDPALIRAGRVDRHFVIPAPVDEQIEQLFLTAYGEPLGYTPRRFENMAKATEIIKKHTFDAEAARKEFCKVDE